jgi:hypothetical protein
MTDFTKTLAVIAATSDVGKIKQIIANTLKKYGPDHEVVVACRARIDELLDEEGEMAEEYEAMRQATIEVTGSDCRLTTLRRNRGPIAAVKALLAKPPSDAFHKLVAAGRTDETVEAIADRHPEHFTPAEVAEACKRLGR